MNILLVSGSLPDVRCGIGDYTARLASELASNPEVSIAVLTSLDERIQTSRLSRVKVLRSPGWGLGALGAVLRTIRHRGPDVVHVQYPAVGYGNRIGIVCLPLAVRLLLRIPVVLTVHERRERRRPARLAIDFMAFSSNLVITLDPIESSDLKQALRGLGPEVLTGSMISTIPVVSGVDRAAWRRRYGA